MKKIISIGLTSLVLITNVFAGAKVSSQSVLVDGKDTGVKGYNIANNNYFKLRDIAALLDEKDAEFNVSYDSDREAVIITSKSDYKKTENDLAPLKDSDSEVKSSTHKVFVNGVRHSFNVYTIDGYNYFQLRQLGKTIGFSVNFDEKNNSVQIDSKSIPGRSLVNNQVNVKIVDYVTDYEEKSLDILKDPLLDISKFLANIKNEVLATSEEGKLSGESTYVKSENIVEVLPTSAKYHGKLVYTPYIKIEQGDKSEVFPYEKGFEVAKTLTSKGFDSTSEFEISLGTKSKDHFVKYSSFKYK